MTQTPPTLLCDFYKVSHREQYPEKTQMIYSTWTPRSNKYHPSVDKVVAFGFQGFIKKFLIDYFNDNFFSRPLKNVITEYARVIKYALGVENPHTKHLEDLHALGYLPLHIRALPEGMCSPIRVPMLTICNTDKRFFWLTNYIETLMSAELWPMSTAATISKEYNVLLSKYAEETGDLGFVKFQGHDFSMRGLIGVEACNLIGSAHLLSFVGSDTVPAIFYLEKYYNANIEKELVCCSVSATEHSVMSTGGDGQNELETYKRLLTKVYPTGIVSIVSDTWDLWKCLSDVISPLKDVIMSRNGKCTIRPDSGDPVKIICGDLSSSNPLAQKGVIEVFWDIFGGTINERGYKVLDPHIGAIYGDSITLDRCKNICEGLKQKGFASTNMVYGIGSYTFQYNTRDTFGFAIKSTACMIDGIQKNIYKNPATDDGTKKSNTGVVAVMKENGKLICKDNLSFYHREPDLMRTIFKDGLLLVNDSLQRIRNRLAEESLWN